MKGYLEDYGMKIGIGVGVGALGVIYFFTKNKRVPEPSGPPYQQLPKTPYSSHPSKHFLTREPRTIGIIGSGVSGVCIAKELLIQGYTVEVLEKNPDLGGVWYQNYANVGLQGASIHYEYPDYPFPEGTEIFPKLPTVKKWLQSYSDQFGVTPIIKFNSEVTCIRQKPDESWEVELSNGETKHYDFLVLCTGLFNIPNTPEFPNASAFKGKIIHSSKVFDTKDLLTNKKVVILGGSRSAMDLSKQSKDLASETTMVFKKMRFYVDLTAKFMGIRVIVLAYNKFSNFFVPPYDNTHTSFWYYLFSPFKFLHTKLLRLSSKGMPPELEFDENQMCYLVNIIDRNFKTGVKDGLIKLERGEIASFTETGVIVNGKEIEADVVILATGFNSQIIGEDSFWHYRNMINPDHKNLAMIGMTETNYRNIYTNIQAVWLCEMLRGAFALPSISSMRSEISKRKSRLFAHSRDTGNSWYFTGDLVDQLLRDMNLSTSRKQNVREDWLASCCNPPDYKSVVTHRV